MRIGIDASCLLKERTGVGTYTYHLLQHLCSLPREHELIVWMNALRGAMPELGGVPGPGCTLKRTRIPGKLLLACWKRLSHPEVEAIIGKIDLLHSPNYFFHPHRATTRTVATIHDLFFLRHPEMAERYGGRYFRDVLWRYCPAIDHFIAVSEATRQDMLRYLPVSADRISVVPHGVDPLFWEAPKRDFGVVSRALRIHGPYFLSVGTIEPRKNYGFLIRAFDAWRRRSKGQELLVIAGRQGWAFQDVYRTAKALDADGWLRMAGYVDPATLCALYRNTRGVVLASLHEGFCLPALEAMASGVPVVASDTPALRETLGGAGLFFEVNNAEQLIDRLDLVRDGGDEVRERVREGRLRAEGFTWRRAAELTWGVYKRVLGQA